jgi:hypothetical protein
MISEEQIVTNWEKFSGLLLQTGDHRVKEIEAMLDHFGDRIMTAPASSRLEYHSCFVGGLVDHSLRVLKNCSRLIKVAPDTFGGIPEESVVFAGLLHDLGKVGDLTNERYLPQTNDYYRGKGNLYEMNHEMPYSTVAHASVFILQHFGIRTTWDEWTAILLNDGPVLVENKPYCMKEPALALLVHQSDRLAAEQEKRP